MSVARAATPALTAAATPRTGPATISTRASDRASFRQGMTTPTVGNLLASEAEHGADCAQEDQRVEPDRLMFDVVEVVLEFDHRVAHRVAIRPVHLRPSGQSRRHDEPGAIE